MAAREFHVPRGLTMDTTLLFFFFLRSCILCAFLADRVHSFGFFFLLCRLSSLCNTDNAPLTLSAHFPWMRIYLSLSRLEVGGASSLNMFCSRPPFFVCVTYYARHRGQFKKTPLPCSLPPNAELT